MVRGAGAHQTGCSISCPEQSSADDTRIPQKATTIHGNLSSAEGESTCGWDYTASAREMVIRPEKIPIPRVSQDCGPGLLLPPRLSFPTAMLLDARKRPTGRFGEDLILRGRQTLQYIGDSAMLRHTRPYSGIPERDAGVTQQAAPLGAFDGTSAKEFAKVPFVQPEKPFQPGKVERFVLRRVRRGGIIFFRGGKNTRLERRQSDNRRAPVPWANVLANVAPKNVISHRRAKLFRDGAPQFNRQIGNALSRVHDVGLDERLRRAGVQAPPATPAQVRRRQFV